MKLIHKVIRWSFFVASLPLHLVWIVFQPVIMPLRWTLSVLFAPLLNTIDWAVEWAGEEYSWRWHVVSVVSLFISALLLLPFLNSIGVVAFLVSTMVHEVFHGLQFRKYGVPVYIIQVGFLGAANIPHEKKFLQMTEGQKADMFLAGPIGSLVVGLVAFGTGNAFLSVGNPEVGQFFLMLANFNVLVAFFQLIALGTLDGGRFFQSIYASLRERQEWLIALPALIISALVMVRVFLDTWNFEIVFFLPFLLFGFVRAKSTDNPKTAYCKTAMNWKQVILALGIYIIVLTICVSLYPKLPSWLPLLTVSPLVEKFGPVILYSYSLWATFEAITRTNRRLIETPVKNHKWLQLGSLGVGQILVLVIGITPLFNVLTEVMGENAPGVLVALTASVGLLLARLTARSIAIAHREAEEKKVKQWTIEPPMLVQG